MGQEIPHSRFSQADHAEFRQRLRDETRALKHHFDECRFDRSTPATAGFEVEGWLVDRDWLPAPRNEAFLAKVHHPFVVPELSRFNFELNSAPLELGAGFLHRTRETLERHWRHCAAAARQLDMDVLAVGMLPTVRNDMLQLPWITTSNRYEALNAELSRLRRQQPAHILIRGEDTLELDAQSVMLEAACTSLQLHLKLDPARAVALYNAAIAACAPLVAVAANAPFLFGRSLWADTRIPTFEQITAVHGFRDTDGHEVLRVTLGTGYLRHSLLELFVENLGYPALLPILSDERSSLPHLRLHNGTIWRWVRPIVGFEPDGTPHLRIEQRVMSAGPSAVDMVANMALSFGLTLALASSTSPIERRVPFEEARSNFYACAREGLDARIRWDGREGSVQSLLLETLIPAARSALAEQGLTASELGEYFDDVLHRRVLSGRTGSAWQRSFIHTHGPDFQGMTERYAQLQHGGSAVHAWTV